MYHHIRGLREDCDLKQKDLSEYSNCNIPIDVLIALAKFYNTSTQHYKI